jgi:hypothetical protein
MLIHVQHISAETSAAHLVFQLQMLQLKRCGAKLLLLAAANAAHFQLQMLQL